MGMNGHVRVVCNETGGGFPKKVQIGSGATLGEVFTAELGHQDADKYTILLNGEAADKDTVLTDEDRIIITPTNVKGNRG